MLLNPSFESPVIGAGNWQNFLAGDTIGSGWVMGSSTAGGDIIVTPRTDWLNAQDGSQVFYFDSQGSGSVSQTFTAVSGSSYQLSFYLSGYAAYSVGVAAAITGGSDSFSQSYTNPDNTTWYLRTLGFTPTSSGTYTLTFTATHPVTAVLDNVSITAVPEPAATAFGLALLGGGAAVQLRRRAGRPA